jgi:HSP20 family protein
MQRWEPFREPEELLQRALQVLEGSGVETGIAPFVPLADIEETDDAWIVEAELPGVDKKDINVDVEGDEISINGEIKERERKGILRRRSRPVGRFELRVRVPGPVDAEHIDAGTEHGVLTVRIPKPQQSKPHRVEVHSSESS